MFEFDLGNEELIRWLLSCGQKMRKRQVRKVQNQLEQMGVSEESVRRALEQLSQDAKVYLQKLTLEEIRMYTQRHDNYERGYKSHTEWFHSVKGSWPHYEKPSYHGNRYRKSRSSCDSFTSQGYPEPLPREGNADFHWQSKQCQSADSRRYSERENHYQQPPRYGISDAYSYRYICREDNTDRHRRKEFYRRKRKIYPYDDSDRRRQNVCDRKMPKVVDEKQNIKSSVFGPINNFISEDLKDSEKVGSEVEKERLSSSKVHDSVACLDIKTNVTGTVCTSETSNVDEQTHGSTVKGTDQTETVLPYESGKDCNIKERESGTLIDVSGKVLEKGVIAYKEQSVSREGGRVLISGKKSSIEEDEHHSSERELMSVVNSVTTEVNPEESALEKEEPYCVISEAEHHSDSKSLVFSNEEVSSVQQETKETSDALDESHGDFHGNSIQTCQDRNCTDNDEGTERGASRKLSKKAEKSEHEIRKSHKVAADFNNDDDNGCEKAKHSSVSCHKENASVQNHAGSGSGVADCKTKVTEVGKTVGQSLGESKPADETQILDNQGKVSMHVPSEHKGLESSHLKLQQSQQNVGLRVTAAEVSYQGRKLQLMVSEIKEASHCDNMKYATTDGSFHRNKKGRGTVIESASVEKTMEIGVKFSKYLVSKEKCGMDQPDSSLSGERNKYVKSVPKYPGVRRTSSQYYTTIDEYFGKNYIKREDENNHNTKDSAKNLGKIECAVNDQQQLVCENNSPVVSMNLEKSDEIIKVSTSSSKRNEKLAKVSASQHGSKCSVSVKRRSSEPCELFSKIHKKRRFSYGGGESSVFGISVDKRMEMRPMGNDINNRKDDDKMLEIDIPELPKTGEQADAYGVSADSGMRMIPGGNETFKARRKEMTKQEKRSSHCPKVEKAATQDIHIEKVTKMKPGEKVVVKNRKKEEEVLEKERPHFSKSEGQDAVEGVSTERGTKVNPAGTEVVKAGKDKENVLGLGSSHCVKSSRQTAANGICIEETTKITAGGSEIVKTGANVGNTLKESPLHLETKVRVSVLSLSTEKTTKLKPGGSEKAKMGKRERILKESPRCLKTGQQATSQVMSVEKAMKIKLKGSEIVKTGKNKVKILKGSPQCLKTKEQAPVQDLSQKKRIKMKPGGREMVICCKNKGSALKKIPQLLDTEEKTTVQDSSREKATKIKPRGNEMVKTGRNGEKIYKESQRSLKKGQQAPAEGESVEKTTHMKARGSEMTNSGQNVKKILKDNSLDLRTEEQAGLQGLSPEKATKMKPRESEMVKTGKKEEKALKGPQNLKRGQEAAAQSVSIEKATKIKCRRSEMLTDGRKEEKILKGSPQHLEIEEQDVVQSLSTEKTTKLKPGGSEREKPGKNGRILKESLRCLKTGQQATCQVMSVEKAMKIKYRGSGIVNTGKNKVKTLKEGSQRLKPGQQAAAYGVSTEKVHNNTLLEMKPQGNELLVTSSVKVCRRERKYHSVISLNDCKRGKNDTLFLEKQNRRNTLEGITNINPFHTSKLDFKFDKCRKKREIMLELFGEDPDELSGSKSDSPDGVCMNVLQESSPCVMSASPCVMSARVSHHSEQNVKFASSLEQNDRQKDNGSTYQVRTFSHESESESNSLIKGAVEHSNQQKTKGAGDHESGSMIKGAVEHSDQQKTKGAGDHESDSLIKGAVEHSDQQKTKGAGDHESGSLIKGAVEHSDQQKTKGAGDHESGSLCPRSEVQEAGSQTLPQFIHSVQQNNHQQENVCDSMTDGAGADTLQQNNEDQSSLTTHKNDMYIVASRTAVLHADTLGKSDQQKDTGPEGCNESELPITCPMKDGMGTVAQNNTQKQNEFGHQKSSDMAHANDVHLTGSSKEGENGKFHLIINTKNVDTLFPNPQKDHCGTTMKLLSVNCNTLTDVNDATNGHSMNIKGVVHADKCSENTGMPSDSAERVAEKRVASPEANVNVSTSDIPVCLKVAGSVDKHVSPIPYTLCCGQSEPDNQHHTVERSFTSEPSQDPVLIYEGSVQDSSSQSQIFRMSASAMEQTEVGIAVKEKCLSESNPVVRVNCNKASCNFSQSALDLNQTQLCTTLQTDIPNSEEITSAVDSSRPTVRSDQLQPESFQANSKSTNDKISHVIDVPVSLTLPRIRVRDPESLGITRREKSFFKDMDTKLCELTEVTYILLQDITRIVQRHRALCRLTGTLKDTEAALAKAEYATHHQIVKAKTFLDLYKYVERSFSNESKDILIKRLSELNPDWAYNSEQLEMCQKYCIWVLRNSQMNLENLGSTSSQVTVSSGSLLQHILQQKFQQQPVGIPVACNVALNTNNQVLSLLQAQGQIPASSEANINSRQHASDSVQNVTSIAPVVCTSSRKEVVTHTGGPAANPTYDVHMRETGSNLNPRHAQTVNIPQQQLPDYNLLQTQNLPGRQFMYTNSDSYIPQPVRETDRTVPVAQGQVLNKPPKERTVPRILSRSNGAQHTTHATVSHGNRSVVSGFTGSRLMSGSIYPPPNSLSLTHRPNLQVAPSHYAFNNLYHQNQAVQQGTLAYHLSKDAFKNTGSSRNIYPSNQHTYQDVFLHTLNKNSALTKSVPNSVNHPYSRNEAMQQDRFSQTASNTLQNTSTQNSSNQPYTRNEATRQHTLPESVGYPPSALQQGVSSHYMNNVALRSSASNSSSHPYVPNQLVNQGMFSRQLSNDPSNTVTGGVRNVSSRDLSASTAGPLREVHGYVHPVRNSFCQAQPLPPPPQYIALSSSLPPPPQYIPLSSSYTQVTPHAQKQVSVQGHHASATQGNSGSYSGASSGIPQQHQAPPVATESRMQFCGTIQSLSHRQGSHGRRNANDIASNIYCDGGTTQNSPANNNFFDRGSNESGSPGNNRVNNQLSDKENKQSRYNVNSAGDNTLYDCRNTWSERASNVCDRRKTHREPANNSLPERGKTHYLSASSVGSNSLFDRRESQSGPVPNRTANNSLCEGVNSQSVSLVDSLFDGRNNQSRPLPNRTADNNLYGKESNQMGSFPVSTSNRLSDKGNSWSRPPAPVNIPSSVTFHARLEGVHQRSNKPTQKLPISEISQQNVNNVTQKRHSSGAANYPSADSSVSVIGHQNVNNNTQKHLSGAAGSSTENIISEIGQQNVNNVTQEHLSRAAGVPSTENRNVSGKSGLFQLHTISEATPLEDPQHEINSNTTETPTSLPNSQIVFHVNQQSSICRSQLGQLSSIVPASAQASGISSSGHTEKTLHLCVCESHSPNHVMHSATVSEPSEKAVPDQQSTTSTIRTEIQQETSGRPTLQTHWTRTSNCDPTNRPGSVEVVDLRNEVQLETESECLGTDVISKQSEQQEIPILTVEDCVPVSISESSKTTTVAATSSSSNKIPTAMVEEAGGSDSEVEILSEVLPQSRTVSRDSGYKTPSPMAGDVGIGNVQKEIPMKKRDFQLTESMYQLEDRMLVGEECEENKPFLEEDYKDSKLMTWFECEEAVSAAWCNTELTSLTWNDSKVAVMREKTESSIQCAVCEKAAEVKCGGCLITCYCSAECQLEDWNTTHHTVCCAGLDE